MENNRTIIFALLLALSIPASTSAQCLEYEPKVVNLSGMLVSEVHPGRPNYESTVKGDESVTIWVIKLKDPICVNGANEIDVMEEAQTEVQIVLEREQYNKYRGLLGQSVFITGKLFHGHTGHHYKRLLLTTSDIESTNGSKK